MKTALYTTDIDTLRYWQKELETQAVIIESDEELFEEFKSNPTMITLADYDTVSASVNRLMQSDQLPQNLVILERNPNITTGKMLILRGIKAYGNSRMLNLHLSQLLQTVNSGRVWMYPDLMSAMIKETHRETHLPNQELIERLSEKEQEVALLVLEGLTNDGISNRMQITTRTVKAHLSSIFSKLHVTDRLGLVLLLK
ncbi:MAG: LuxR C-terminal-related transcriptional regulator [Campylobacterota bacterium]|nr:LuxR C-terminal-related transcriptional regulator [Campylobacterota bacterium]